MSRSRSHPHPSHPHPPGRIFYLPQRKGKSGRAVLARHRLCRDDRHLLGLRGHPPDHRQCADQVGPLAPVQPPTLTRPAAGTAGSPPAGSGRANPVDLLGRQAIGSTFSACRVPRASRCRRLRAVPDGGTGADGDRNTSPTGRTVCFRAPGRPQSDPFLFDQGQAEPMNDSLAPGAGSAAPSVTQGGPRRWCPG